MTSRSAQQPTGELEVGTVLNDLVVAYSRWAPRDVPFTVAWTLSTLNAGPPRRVTDLAAEHGVTQPTMTKLIRALETAGLAERTEDPADRRAAFITLTAEGKRIARARRRAGGELLATFIPRLTPDERDALQSALPALLRLLSLVNTEPRIMKLI